MSIFFALLLVCLVFGTQAQQSFNWPKGKKAAVVLTYDDAIDCHLDIVVPALDEYGYKGTFFLTGSAQSVANRSEAWRAIAANDHELANHTLFHPCRKVIPGERNFDWIRPEYDLDGYSFPQLINELNTANSLLHALDGKSERTFAYTCVDHTIQGVDFSDSIQHIFVAARGLSPVPESLRGVDPYLMPSTSAAELTGEQLIAEVKKAQANGTVITFLFHSVGGGYLNTSAEAHRELLDYLKQNQDKLWIDTFLNVTQHVQREQARLGW
ncbi:polysaccharide deacetylase family protein [Reichenbachiella carrageenanivorans]|uniref:Polysaccharide deacetylase family protein n=1 Tax=Reichenbachiella carrageenanivorans TaxID=2979869 RepID=A0ABY6D161_9BACT|nr:polysaccharide deacetylase family protein [Reichenbachiella carrageenanivorans]UXX79902.1 polysaccharide deacetylase family protein [Reichenbachiella carrageenanivorans]